MKKKKRDGFPLPAARFRARLFVRCLGLFFLLPLAARLLLAILPAMGAFFLTSRGLGGAWVEYAVRVLAVLDDMTAPVLMCAGVCTLCYGVFRHGMKHCAHALFAAVFSPLLLRLTVFLLTALLVKERMIDSMTPSDFAAKLPAYVGSLLLLYASDLLFLLLFVMLSYRSGRRFLGREMGLAGQKQIFFAKSGYAVLVRLTVILSIVRYAARTAREIFTGLAGGYGDYSILEIAKDYGVWSRETVFRLISGGILPIFYLALTGAAVFLCSRLAAGKAEEMYFSMEKENSGGISQKAAARGVKDGK